MIIEKTILDYLITADIEGIGGNVYLETPNKDFERYVLIQKTGSSAENKLNKATIAVQSISAVSLYDAASINEKIKELLDEIVFVTPIYRSELNSDYNFTDSETKQYRYQAVYQITY